MTLTSAARTLHNARARLAAALTIAEDEARQAHAAGKPETEIARTLGVNRTTVRKWLGK